MDAAIDFALEQASGLENTQVLGHGWERKWERLGELCHGGFALSEAGEEGAACGIGECGESGIERRGRRIVNHMVKYSPAFTRVKQNSRR